MTQTYEHHGKSQLDAYSKRFEILFIYTSGLEKSWHNHNIGKLCNFKDGWDNNVHRIWLRTDKGDIQVVVKSQMLDEYWKNKKYDEEKEIYIEDEQALQDALEYLFFVVPLYLTEDFWAPNGEQFCFTELGQKISEMIIGEEMKGLNRIDFSPDCAVSDDGDNEYSWST